MHGFDFGVFLINCNIDITLREKISPRQSHISQCVSGIKTHGVLPAHPLLRARIVILRSDGTKSTIIVTQINSPTAAPRLFSSCRRALHQMDMCARRRSLSWRFCYPIIKKKPAAQTKRRERGGFLCLHFKTSTREASAANTGC